VSGSLVELAVSDLGIIDDLRLVFGPGMTVVSGETGAGKTLIVEAIDLLVGGRADPDLVRPGAEHARVEGRFELDGEEVILARVVPREGRSRAYLNGRLATAAALTEAGVRLVDLHGQHAHQSLLATRAQRATLDRYAGTDLSRLATLRARIAAVDEELAELGGDERMRAREIDLLSYQLEEIDGAAIEDPDEDERLDGEEDVLGDAVAHREGAATSVAALVDDEGAADSMATALAAVDGRPPFDDLADRLRAVVAELRDVAAELRSRGEAISDDPSRLAELRVRRQTLRDLQRKYGDDLSAVLAYRDDIADRLKVLTDHDARAAELDAARVDASAAYAVEAAKVAELRRTQAPKLAKSIAERLDHLAMAGSEIRIEVGGPDPADDIDILLSANRGAPPLPLRKVASGGELARTMLAIRLVLTVGPPVLVFDEVDAGIGGEAATSVGRALAELSNDHQVLVVTHLPQVAAWADHHVRVSKATSAGDATISTAIVLDAAERRTELARMLSGQPDSGIAIDHAAELLERAGRGSTR